MKALLYLGMLLFLLMSAIGGERGIKSFFTLGLNALIAFISIYLIGYKAPILVIFVLSTVLFGVVTIFFQNGWNRKTKASMIACAILTFFLGIVIFLFVIPAHLVGFDEIELQGSDATYLSSNVSLSMFLILLMSLIWTMLGALIDTSIAVSSAMNEVLLYKPFLEKKDLFQRGIKFGGSIIGTMVSTLIFVGLGESMMLIFYYINYRYPIYRILNSKSFLLDISGIFISCISCSFIIPVTAFVFAFMVEKRKEL